MSDTDTADFMAQLIAGGEAQRAAVGNARGVTREIALPYILEEWEFGTFLCPDYIQAQVTATVTALQQFKASRQSPPPNLVAQKAKLEAKFARLQEDLNSGKLSGDEYLRLLKTEGPKAREKANEFPPDSPTHKELLKRAQITEQNAQREKA